MLKKLRAALKRHGLTNCICLADRKIGIGRLEYLFYTHWFNPFATFWINLRSLPLTQAIRFPIWVYGRPKFYCLSGRARFDCNVRSGMIKYNIVRAGAPSVQNMNSELCNYGDIIFKGGGTIGCGTKIFVEFKAKLELGDDFEIMDMINIGCLKSIIIGYSASITHRCQILDSNYHYIANFPKKVVPDCSTPVVIGNGCWIGNSTTVTGGAHIPDFTIVASNSLVNHKSNNVPENSIIGGQPARLIATGIRRIYNSEYHSLVETHYKSDSQTIFQIPNNWTMNECTHYQIFNNNNNNNGSNT